MPKLEPKQIQKEIENGLFWPVYWFFGQEQMKSRELLKRIRKGVLGEETALTSFAQENLEGSEVNVGQVLDAAQSLSLGGGVRFVLVRDAHLIKESELLAPLLGPKAKREELSSVCVFLSKDLDARKKFSKLLLEKAAVVPCEEVAEEEREAWIGYLSKRRGTELPQELVARLRGLDPWSLDIVDQELEKYSLALTSGTTDAGQVVLGGFESGGGADSFLDAFFCKNLKQSMECLQEFADRPDEALPLLGLFSWSVRQMALIASDRERGTRTVKLSPFLAERFTRWGGHWSLREILALQSGLADLDFGIKQTPQPPLGLWVNLVTSSLTHR